MSSGVLDLGKLFGLRQTTWGQRDNPLIMEDLGFTIGAVQDKFPNYVAMLRFLGWSDSDILKRTYPTACFNEAGLMMDGGFSGTGWLSRTPIFVPSGHWHFNSELRAGQTRIFGGSSIINSGQGGTEWQMNGTHWKSIHGPQNDGIRIGMHPWNYAGQQNLTPQPVAIGGGHEWAHGFQVHHMRFLGTAKNSTFWIPSDDWEILILLHTTGENSGLFDVACSKSRTFGTLISGNMAPLRIEMYESFYNHIAAIGMCGGARGKASIKDCSGDNNPWYLCQYTAGSEFLIPGIPVLPMSTSGVPGGIIDASGWKIEAFCFLGGTPGWYEVPPPDLAGKGGMLARITGRTKITFIAPTLHAHAGKLFAAVEWVDDQWMRSQYPGRGYGNVGFAASEINIIGSQMSFIDNWLVDYKNGRRFPMNWNDSDNTLSEFRMVDTFNGIDVAQGYAQTKDGPIAWSPESANYRGRQPYINASQTGLSFNSDMPPTFNYDIITGIPY